MPIWKRLPACAMLLSVLLAVSGCATSSATPTTSPPKLVDLSKQKLRPFKTRAGDTCETQREAAAQNSVRDSRPGAEVVYCSACDCPQLYDAKGEPRAGAGAERAPAAPQKPEPSTSSLAGGEPIT